MPHEREELSTNPAHSTGSKDEAGSSGAERDSDDDDNHSEGSSHQEQSRVQALYANQVTINGANVLKRERRNVKLHSKYMYSCN